MPPSSHFTHCLIGAALASILAASSNAQLVGPIDFESAGQLAANFRGTFNTATASQATSGGRGFVGVNANASGANPYISIYDTTPGSSADASPTFGGRIEIHLEISASTANASFGIFLFDDANRNGNNILALLNLDSSAGGAGNEQVRFWRDTALTGSAVANQYTTAFLSGTNGSLDAATNAWVTDTATAGALTIDSSSPFTFYSLDFIYDPLAMTLTVATDAFEATLAIPATDFIENPGIAVRINDPSIGDTNTQKFDTFSVVPEPASAAFLACGLALFGLRRRR